jgi:hypothetical protein
MRDSSARFMSAECDVTQFYVKRADADLKKIKFKTVLL